MAIKNSFRLCACGCGATLNGQRSQKFASGACRQSDFRQRHRRNSHRTNSRYSVRDLHRKQNGIRNVCTILFDKENRPIEIEFHRDVDRAKSYINDMKLKEVLGAKYSLFLAEVFCNEFFPMPVTAIGNQK